MFLYEYDEEKHKKFLREEGFEEGYSVGEKSGYAAGEKSGVKLGKILAYHELGISSDEISKKLNIDECTVKEIIKNNI